MEMFALLILLCLACWTGSCRSSLRKLTGGLLRTLEDRIQSNCQYLDDHRPRFGFVLRAASFIFTTTYTLISYKFFILDGAKNTHTENVTYFVLVLVLYLLTREVLGSIWTRNYGIKILSNSLPALKVLNILFFPYITIVLSLHHNHEARLEESDNNTKVSAEDEILSLVEEDEENDREDSIEDEEARMIKGVFNLDDTTIREVMIPRTSITGVEKDTPLEEIKKLFISSGYSRLPVYDEKPDTIIGLVYAKDFLDYSKICQSKLNDLLRPVEFVPETETLDITLPNFRKKKIHLAIVQDEFGGTAGLVTMEDLLEEIVGEIHDEFDTEEESHLQALENGSLILDPRATISEINQALNSNIPDEEFDTIGAYVYSITGDIPKAQTKVECDFFQVEILEADERNIISLSLQINSETEKA
ncbi:hemolysin family protein [Lentisphaera marina]|uniref:hemolysin family protein n=1 Tax=Lentisphaera marina TaxID=1111041 RepID=UPI0023665A14|nr:hemolysin family protein [Lentisphaera marina]MDD7983657.1 hemolysin family protein [Lentisphaera marina]